MRKKNISIVGTGLIGSSIALGLRDKFNGIIGFDSDQKTIDYAVKSGIIDFGVTMDCICSHSDIIVVAIPADIALKVIPDILEKSKDDTIVIDASSTKVPICDLLRNHPKRANFVAAHPMAGSEAGGPQNATANLFDGRKVIICQSELSSTVALEQSRIIFETLGMTVELMDDDVHDNLVALVSHLPQVVSYAIASTVAHSINGDHQWGTVASSGFDSSTRLAKSSPTIWTPILIQNKRNLSQQLQLLINQIEAIKKFIEEEDADAINQFIHQSQIIREEFEKKQTTIIKQKDGNKTITRISAPSAVASGCE